MLGRGFRDLIDQKDHRIGVISRTECGPAAYYGEPLASEDDQIEDPNRQIGTVYGSQGPFTYFLSFDGFEDDFHFLHLVSSCFPVPSVGAQVLQYTLSQVAQRQPFTDPSGTAR